MEFQSTLSWRERHSSFIPLPDAKVFQSTLSWRERRSWSYSVNHHGSDFNPRSPEESDCNHKFYISKEKIFQSTLSWRERPSNWKETGNDRHFNPRSPEESDSIQTYNMKIKFVFQSTLSWRERPLQVQLYLLWYTFQSTLSWRERLYIKRGKKGAI